MCTGGAQKRWKINTIDATHNSASPVDAVVFEHRGHPGHDRWKR
jgi:hypothetical protein